MKKWLSRMGTNQRLAVLALALGLGAAFARPMAAGTVRVDAQELAAELQRGGIVRPQELRDWIVKGTTDFRIVDVRDESAFASYHIPGAENVPLAALADSGILHNERVVLYADDATRTAQAWFVMRALGFRDARALGGGLAGWTGQAAGPSLPAATVAPRIELPPMPAGGVKAGPKKKKEGC